MTEPELTAEIVLAEFVPEQARCPELYRAVDAAIVAGDVTRLAALIRATQEQQQAQLDSHSRQLSQIQQAVGELQSRQQPVTIIYSDNRQWHQDARRWTTTKTTTTTIDSDWSWLLSWACVAIVAALLAPVLCPPNSQSYQPAIHERGRP
ncbi:hypothetical protein [Kamptonema formosum]|uniref:hypothetical protein n=1 Tax=Kamptonema formosum TaxID=331992 RepID=UPI00034ABED5|nr:hypothetical protein [Oscillatoria sp. PCC 10802]